MPEQKNPPTVVVIGGGPAGLMAAGTAAANGARVILFEKMQQCGQKLLITGAGQCNVTNSAPWPDFIAQYPENAKFLYPAFKTFFVDDLKAFFQQHGLLLVLEDNGKYFPETRRAASVLDALLAYCHEHQVLIHCQEPVDQITPDENGWTVSSARQSCRADAVILATGGLSYPRTGSNGDGYRLAMQWSHTLSSTRPALVPLEIACPDCASLSGVSLPDVIVELRQRPAKDAPPRRTACQRGSLLFTHFGVSGPAILSLSRWLPAESGAWPEDGQYELALDLLPALSAETIDRRLLDVFAALPKRQLKNILGRDFELPYAFAARFLATCGLPEDILCQAVTRDLRKMIITQLKSFCLLIAKSRGYREAMVTAGGISTQEINPRTMASRLRPGLFFAGEIIDVDGFTGGFNLQAAFSTGYLAGLSAACVQKPEGFD